MSHEREEILVSNVAFKMHNYWPYYPDTWFRQMKRFRVCNITRPTIKFDLAY
jgi:hypothetical protein